MTAPPQPGDFTVRFSRLASGLRLAYLREGEGGFPLVLLHGFPETKRIWWRNVAPLAAAGFEVVVPDLRGYGDSDLPPDEPSDRPGNGLGDVAVMSEDVHDLVAGVLGHERCAVVAGDLGGVVAQDLSLRFPSFVVRQCLFNTIAPRLPELYRQAGVAPDPPRDARPTADYFLRQGFDADALGAELDSPQRRRSYVADFYGHRLWASPGHFTPADVAFMVEPFADAGRLRAGFAAYEVACRRRPVTQRPRTAEPSDVPTLVLYGPDDHVVDRTFPDKCAVAFSECIGPFVVPGAGHFLQWEAAGVLNRALAYFLADLAGPARATGDLPGSGTVTLP